MCLHSCPHTHAATSSAQPFLVRVFITACRPTAACSVRPLSQVRAHTRVATTNESPIGPLLMVPASFDGRPCHLYFLPLPSSRIAPSSAAPQRAFHPTAPLNTARCDVGRILTRTPRACHNDQWLRVVHFAAFPRPVPLLHDRCRRSGIQEVVVALFLSGIPTAMADLQRRPSPPLLRSLHL